MRACLISVIALSANIVLPAVAGAQAAEPAVPPPGFLDRPYYLPTEPPRNLAPSAVPDLSGDWARENRAGRVTGSQSLSVADRNARIRGKEPDIPYHPWALEYTMKQVPPTGGADSKFELTTDPYIHTCEPLGVGRIHNYPAKFRFVQTPEAVYILSEVGPQYRVVWLNTKHPEDPDPQYLGHSIGWYENGDTLVVDSIGFNDRTWLDQQGHPHTEKLHFIERYKKADKSSLELTMTIDDPAAYTKPWQGNLNFTTSESGFLRYQWVCSRRDNYAHFEKVGAAGTVGESSFKK
ncbi:MAG: hypothetical protein ABL993_08950 [Vicinamibacterales bacterium]